MICNGQNIFTPCKGSLQRSRYAALQCGATTGFTRLANCFMQMMLSIFNIRSAVICCFATTICAALVGCEKSPPPAFQLNMVAMAKAGVGEANQQAVADALGAMFGTPDAPFVLPESGLNLDKLKRAAGPVHSDKSGLGAGLYREHCVHCHGISGDGMGPTAAFLKPYPRDYRPGLYKFKSTIRAEMPTDDDLTRVIRYGVPGTAMPAFQVALTPADTEALVEYVKYLSMRGQTELKLLEQIDQLGENETLPTNREILVEGSLQPVADKWKVAEEKIVQAPTVPADFRSAASIEKGRELFFSKKGNCFSCHGTTGLGDGQRDDYDDWTKPNVNMLKEVVASIAGIPETRRELENGPNLIAAQITEVEKDRNLTDADRQTKLESLKSELTEAKRSLPKKLADIDKREKLERRRQSILATHTLPARNIEPRNLRQGIYRGGRRPIDVFYRINQGINGAPMPASAGPVAPEEMWNIVDYVLALPYERGGELSVDRTMAARERN